MKLGVVWALVILGLGIVQAGASLDPGLPGKSASIRGRSTRTSDMIPVWIEFGDRPRFTEADLGLSLPPLNESYVEQVLRQPGVEFIGRSELTNQLGIWAKREILSGLAGLHFVSRLEPMPLLQRYQENDALPPYSAYQAVSYNSIQLRALQDSFSGYIPSYSNGDTAGKHLKIGIIDSGIDFSHPMFWNSEIQLTPGVSFNSREPPSLAARDSFVHLAAQRDPLGLYYRRSRDFGINWSPARLLTTDPACPDITASGDNVYIASLTEGERDVEFWRSPDNGDAWIGPVALTSYPSYMHATNVRIAAAGDAVYVVWEEWEDLSAEPWFTTRIRIRRSLNRGLTFEPSDSLAGTGQTCFSSGPDIAASEQSVHVVWWEGISWQPSPQRLRYRSSNDRGATWT
ncbi:MAG: hypothetical protein ABIK62_03890, partial [candidate division WOR-3 bacterium]